MIKTIEISIFALLYLYPIKVFISSWFKDEAWQSKWIYFFIGSTTLPPIVIFYMGYFFKVPFTQSNVVTILLGLNILALLIKHGQKGNQRQKALATSPDSTTNKILITLIMFGAVVLYFPYWANKQPLVGGDSPHYLTNATLLIKNTTPAIVFDRNIIYYLPAIGAILFSISVENMMKLTIVGYELTFVAVSLAIARRYMSLHFLLLMGLVAIFSPALFNLSKFTPPFFMATVVVYVMLEILGKPKKIPHWLLFFYLWGILFNLHGVIAFAALGIIPPLLMMRKIRETLTLKTALAGLVMLMCTSQPLIFTQTERLIEGFLVPIEQTLGLSVVKPINTPTPEWRQEELAILVDEYTNPNLPKLTAFPLLKDSFTSTYSIIGIMAFLVGAWAIGGMRGNSGGTAKVIFYWTVIGLFILTQQEFVGINWFANRFVFTLAPFIYIGALYGLEHLGNVLKQKTIAWYGAVGLLVLPVVLVGFHKITNLTASISLTEYQFVKEIARTNTKPQAIFVGAGQAGWIQALAPQWQVFTVNYQALCADESFKNLVDKDLWEIGSAFSKKSTLEQSMATFEKYAKTTKYLVYLDTANYHCINGNLFPGDIYPLIAQGEGLMLLERVDNIH